MDIVVQKYGGTSVDTPENRQYILLNAKDAIEDGLHPVIVVSAMGRFPSPYATDTLLSLIKSGKKQARHKDILSSCGEVISSVVVAEELCAGGIKATALTGAQAGIKTDGNFGEGIIQNIDTKRIIKLVQKGIVPVVAGFQGGSDEGEITTVGRGGSDITATALGGALNATIVEIYTDVDGVMTADPNVVDSAELLDAINYNDVFRLASLGAKVIHPRAVEFAMDSDVPVSILKAKNGRKGKHTLIADSSEVRNKNKLFSAITALSGCVQVQVDCPDIIKQDKMFSSLAERHISLDMINIFTEHTVFVIAEADINSLRDYMSEAEMSYTITENFTKITALGDSIHGTPGVLARMIAVLYSENIRVYQSSDSNDTISLLIESSEAKKAVKLLHKLLIH